MTTMHYFGNVCCRGDERKMSGTIDSELIDVAFAVRSNQRLVDEYLENLPVDVTDFDEVNLLCGIAQPFMANEGEFENWKNNRTFVIIMEECEYAVAPTLRDAKVAWAEIDE